METVRPLPTLPAHSPVSSNSRLGNMPATYNQAPQTPSRPPSQQSAGPPSHHSSRSGHQMVEGSPYKMRAGPGGQGGLHISGVVGHVGHEPVTPPPPPSHSTHSNLSQLARTHPYANAISTTGTGVTVSGRYTVPASGLYSNAYSRMDPRDAPTSFPLRSPPDRPGEFRRNRLTLLPHGAPVEYGSVMHNLSGPGPGGGGRPHPYTLPPLPYSASQNDSYREPVYLSVSSSTSEPLHKKLRVTDNGSDSHLPKAELGQPLRIDTRPPPQSRAEQQAYIPQVEAISPTPGEGDDLKRDDSPPRSSKEDLLQQINKVDREIMKAESNILKLKKKLQDLEEAAKKPPEAAEITAQSRPKNQSVAQQIYAENRKKAQAAHQTLSPLGPPVDLPLYHQPSDTAVYHKNRTQYATFRPRLLKFLQRRHKGKELRDRYLTATYNKLLSGWIRRVSDMEKAAASSAAAAAGTVVTSSSTANTPTAAGQAAAVPVNPTLTKKKEREFYEKVFPELRKQREDKERFNRVGSRIKSDADLEEIMDGLQEQENEDKKMRSLAVVPPILLDARERRYRFDNRNGLVEDPMAEHRERQLLNVWTEQEREIFKEKYLQHPKNFVTIAAYLERKSVSDCVQFYYLSKKTVNYKQLLRKTKMKRNTRSTMQKPGAASAAAASAAAAAAQNQAQGVTTRLQREQQSRQETVSSTATMSTSSVITVSAASSSSSSIADTVTSVQTTTATSVMASSVISIGTQNLATSATAPPQSDDGNTPQAPAAPAEQLVQKGDEKERRRDKWPEKPEAATVDSSDDEADGSSMAANATGGGPHPCAVCKTMLEHFGQSRRLPKHQASQYGLHENDVNDDTRVCSACRCQVVRRRYFTCTLPTCPTAKRRVKRLRPLPNKWIELPVEIKSILENEFQIGPGVTKCCSTCSNRISRRLSALTGSAPADMTRSGNVEGSRQENDAAAGGIPTLSSGEEMSGSSTSSGEEDVQSDVDAMQIVTEAPEAAVVVKETRAPPVDNSETDSADEVGVNAVGQGEVMGPPHTLGGEKVSAAPAAVAAHPPPQPVPAAPMTSVPQETLTVKDIMLGMIERSLSRDNTHASPSPAMGPGFAATSQLSGPSESPTITSILKESRNYVAGGKPGGGSPIVAVSHASSTPPMVLPPPQVQVQMNLRAQSHHPEQLKQQVPEHPSLVSQNRRSSPYPISMFPPPQHMLPPGSYAPHESDPNLPREGLAAVLHGQQAARDYERDRARMREPPPSSAGSECQTLDLSMPKKRDTGKEEGTMTPGPSVSLPPVSAYAAYPPPAHSKLPPPSVTIEQYRGAPNVMDPVAIYQHQQGMRPSTPHQKLAPPPPAQSSRPSGSITQGTPVGQGHHHPLSFQPPPRTDGLLRTVPPPRETPGSITQGTPILHVKDQPPHHYERASPLNYYKSASPASAPGVPRGPYPQDPQQSSRQIIINDYLTSQQMVGGSGARRERELPTSHPQSLTIERASEARGAYPYRYATPVYLPRGTSYVDQHPGHHPQPQQQQPPPQQQQHHPQQPPPQQQQRQGVIQRTSSVPQQPRPVESRQVNSHQGPPQLPPHHGPHGRTASPGVVHISAAGHYQPGRPQMLSHRDPRDYAEDPFNALVNAAAAQPSLPVPGNTRDRDRQPVPGPPPRLVPDRKDEAAERVMAFQRESPKVGAPPPGSDTLTAASLIDAIITHQINQTAASQSDSGGKSSVDSLFNRYRRNASPTDARPATSKEREEPSVQIQPPKAVLTLGEHVESIIVKDFHQGGPGGQPAPPPPPQSNDQQSWERERERNWQRQHNEYMKNRIAEGFGHGRDTNPGLDYGKARDNRSPATSVPPSSSSAAVDLVKGGRVAGPQEVRIVEQDNRAPISPLDYFTNRIKEVMRTSDNCQTEPGRDMRPPSSPSTGRRGVSPAPSPNKRPRMTPESEDAYPPPPHPPPAPHPPGQAHQPHFMAGPYPGMAYTYMPLSMGMPNSAPPSSSSQPTVVLSSQYETLSDED